MPLEIRELIVRAHIDPRPETEQAGRGSATSPPPTDTWVRQTVYEALRALDDRRER